MTKSIFKYLNQPEASRDYEEGLALLSKVSSNRNLLAFLQKKETQASRDKLAYELGKACPEWLEKLAEAEAKAKAEAEAEAKAKAQAEAEAKAKAEAEAEAKAKAEAEAEAKAKAEAEAAKAESAETDQSSADAGAEADKKK